MSEKSRKHDKSSPSDDARRKQPNSSKPNFDTKNSFGKRKSSGDNDDEETSQKSAKFDKKPKPIKMALGSQKQQEAAIKPLGKKMTVAAAFGDDSDSEPEEMPPEAKMRMKNIGRETPTAAGPNSFGKTKFGFTDTHRKHERLLQEVAKQVDG